jgi:hypothetical protein
MGCDGDQLQHRTERGGYAVTTGGVCLDGEEKGQIDGSKATLDVVYGGNGGGDCVRRPWLPGNPAE